MLYLNSLENSAISGQENRFVICHQPVDSMQTIPELAPSQQLLDQWQTKSIEWAEFREQYLQEMREEFLGEKSRLQGVAKYSLENDVTLHSPEPSGQQTYRALLGQIINGIWKQEQQGGCIVDLALPPASKHSPKNQKMMQAIAENCDHFSVVKTWANGPRSCEGCYYLDRQVYACPPTDQVVIEYQWT